MGIRSHNDIMTIRLEMPPDPEKWVYISGAADREKKDAAHRVLFAEKIQEHGKHDADDYAGDDREAE